MRGGGGGRLNSCSTSIFLADSTFLNPAVNRAVIGSNVLIETSVKLEKFSVILVGMRHAVLLKTTARPFTQKQLHSIRQGKVLIHIGTQRDTPKFLVHSRSSLSDTWLASPDYEKERSELFGLAIFGHRDWKKHKEEDRYLRHVGSLARY